MQEANQSISMNVCQGGAGPDPNKNIICFLKASAAQDVNQVVCVEEDFS